ncbi:MAG: GNAT family N-acetyltransferase [Planctomycetota bacterium]
MGRATGDTRIGGVVVRDAVGAEIARYMDDLARLRLRVFAEWPYLYDGGEAEERDYLSAMAGSAEALCVLAIDERDGDRVVGASTAMPLGDEHAEFREPFERAGIDVGSVFYLAESVLLPAYRGRGIGRVFFDRRESYGRRLDGRRRASGGAGFAWLAFCGVDRVPDDPRRPAGHRELGPWWRSLGYRRRDDLVARLAWSEIGEAEASEKPLTFWLKPMQGVQHPPP